MAKCKDPPISVPRCGGYEIHYQAGTACMVRRACAHACVLACVCIPTQPHSPSSSVVSSVALLLSAGWQLQGSIPEGRVQEWGGSKPRCLEASAPQEGYQCPHPPIPAVQSQGKLYSEGDSPRRKAGSGPPAAWENGGLAWQHWLEIFTWREMPGNNEPQIPHKHNLEPQN